MTNAGWQPTTIIRGDLAAEVAGLKDRHAGEIQVHGSAALAQTLHGRGLIDEYRIFIEPIVLGAGKRLFEPGAAPAALQLVESKTLRSGSVLATYRPNGQPTYGEFQMEEGLGLPEPDANGRPASRAVR
jgi:dihydrofolate reductase